MEFTGKQRTVYHIEVRLLSQRQVEHISEGWLPQPATEPKVEDVHIIKTVSSQEEALRIFSQIANTRD